VSGATITDELNHEPNTASFNVSGIVPLAGQSVTIQCGDTDLTHQLFGGRIIAVNKTYEAEKPANVIYRCNAIDPTWLLNRRKVTKKYTSQSATAIALDVISSFTSGVTTVNVAAGLATIDEITFTNEEVTDALTRICRADRRLLVHRLLQRSPSLPVGNRDGLSDHHGGAARDGGHYEQRGSLADRDPSDCARRRGERDQRCPGRRNHGPRSGIFRGTRAAAARSNVGRNGSRIRACRRSRRAAPPAL
jgi:hypothetical protein